MAGQVLSPGLLPQVHGQPGAEQLQLWAPVHTVYLAGWLLSRRHAKGTGTSEEQPLPPQFEIAAPRAGSRHGRGVAADFQSLRGGREWECSLVGAGGIWGGLLWWAAAWSLHGKGHWQRMQIPKIK